MSSFRGYSLKDMLQLLEQRRYDHLAAALATHVGESGWIAFFHCLAQAGLGQVASALRNARPLLQKPLDPLSLADALRLMGLVLEQQGHPELARGWLEQSAGLAPGDDRSRAALLRCRPPTWLAPEVWAPGQQTTLMRHAPREAWHYVYTIDIVGTCNLRCPTCPVGNMDNSGRATGFMPMPMFEDILQRITEQSPDPAPQIWLFNWGEPLLHPELPAMVRKITEQGFTSYLSSNLNIKKGIDELIAANPDKLKISISGASQQTYAQTHVRGKLDRVLANMRKIRTALDHHRSTTHVWVGQHVYRHNQHEVARMAEICAELGFEHQPVAAFYQPLEALVRIAEDSTQTAPVLDLLLEHPRDYIQRFRQVRDARFDCELRFNQTVINHDGSVALCCSVYTPENQLGVQFLDHDHAALEAMKYSHDFCKTCYRHGLQYAPSVVHDVDQVPVASSKPV